MSQTLFPKFYNVLAYRSAKIKTSHTPRSTEIFVTAMTSCN